MILIVLPLNSRWLIPSIYYCTFHLAQVTLYAIIDISYCLSNSQVINLCNNTFGNVVTFTAYEFTVYPNGMKTTSIFYKH